MSNHIKGCGCRMCRSGMRTESKGQTIQKFIRKVRRNAKLALRRGEEPAPTVSLPYTD